MYHPVLPVLYRSSQPQRKDEHYIPVLCYLCWCSPTHSRAPSPQVGCTIPAAGTTNIGSLTTWLFNCWLWNNIYMYVCVCVGVYICTHVLHPLPTSQPGFWYSQNIPTFSWPPGDWDNLLAWPSLHPALSSSCQPAKEEWFIFLMNFPRQTKSGKLCNKSRWSIFTSRHREAPSFPT